MSLAIQLEGYRLTTAEITYHRPDHPGVLQGFVWQEMDLAPKFPELTSFLDFWETEIEGKLHSVLVASSQLIKPAEFKWVDSALRLH